MEIHKLEPHIENILTERYYLKNETSWEQLAKRVSCLHPKMYDYILKRRFIPSTPTLMNLNTNGEHQGTLSSCFILDIEDNLVGIMDSMKEAALVTKAAGGVGYNFSKLRAASENVKSINANSGGVMAFIQIFDSVLDGVRQGGRRRGAGMSMLSVYHPDILTFIDSKAGDTKKYTRSNFSVCLDSNFYDTIEKNPTKTFRTKNVVDKKENDLIGNDGLVYTYKMLWDKIIHNAWSKAEPGIFNGDIAVDRCTCKHITRNVFCNPCSEYVHIPYTSCNLSSFNVASFILDNKEFDWVGFSDAVEEAVVYMNGIIDENDYPIEKIKKETLAVRPIGMGVMGLAHLLYMMEVPYDSVEAYKFVEKLFKFQTLVAMRKSMELAKKTGKTYKYYDYDVFMDANARFFTSETFMEIDVSKLKANIKKYGMYNSCLTSVAPTGTISYIADCSGGIEPVFGLVFTRKIEKENKGYEKVYMIDGVFRKFVEKKYPEQSTKIYEYISKNNGSCVGCDMLTKKEQSIFKTAGDITPDWHLKILAAVANNINLSVSKTINLPKNCSEKEVGEVFIKACELGVIGVTVYRDGCREGILVHNNDIQMPEHIERHNAPKRPEDLPCDIHEMNVVIDGKKERFVALIGKLAGTVYEIFVTKDIKNKLDFEKHKTGIIRKVKKGRYDLIIMNGEERIYIEDMSKTFGGKLGTLSRLTSMSLRHGTPLPFVADQLSKGVDGTMLDFERCVARVLKYYIKEGERVITSETCGSCGKPLIYMEGCKTCSDKECGWSKCS